MMEFCFGNLGFEQVLTFLRETDKEFKHPLSEKVNLEEYARKLSQYSSFSYCVEQDEMIGMISCYTNRPPEGYISNVCVKSSHQGCGVFSKMLDELLKRSATLGIKRLKLEVNDDNENAIWVYEKWGFRIIGNASQCSKYMVLEL